MLFEKEKTWCFLRKGRKIIKEEKEPLSLKFVLAGIPAQTGKVAYLKPVSFKITSGRSSSE